MRNREQQPSDPQIVSDGTTAAFITAARIQAEKARQRASYQIWIAPFFKPKPHECANSGGQNEDEGDPSI